ncbi:MAG: rhomboid family intramembrane serine protease, partial [Nanoarchaeota archaeon]|nr:rhomboid family intramembrane serine protease [Nanoarchaeota archaeon]
MRQEIESEMKFVWKQILFILKLPITIILVLFKKKEAKDLFEPLNDFWKFVTEPKVTFSLMMVIIAVFIAELYMPTSLLQSLIFKPEHLWNLNFVPMIASWFLHANLTHIIGNLLALFVFGRIVEKK